MFDWLKKQLGKGGAHERKAPPFWQAYLDSFRGRPFDKKQPVEAVSFVVFDTETTGLDLRTDQILSIAALRVQAWQIDLSDRLEYFVHQAYRPEQKAVAIHGILPGEREHSLSEAEAIARFLAFCGSSVLVGHHAAFDVAMVNEALKGMGAGKLRNKQLDTGVLARRLARSSHSGPQPPLGLDELCQQYGIPMSDRHTAAGDTYITAILLIKLLYRLEMRGVRTLGGLLAARGTGLV